MKYTVKDGCWTLAASKKITSAIGALKSVRQFVPQLTPWKWTTLLSNCILTIAALFERFWVQNYSEASKLHNCAARIITFSSYDSSFGPLVQKLGWDRLLIRRIKLLAIEMFKVYNNMAPEYLCQNEVHL